MRTAWWPANCTCPIACYRNRALATNQVVGGAMSVAVWNRTFDDEGGHVNGDEDACGREVAGTGGSIAGGASWHRPIGAWDQVSAANSTHEWWR